MKKTLYLSLIGLLCSLSTLFAQNINLSDDSLRIFLCKNWEMDYVIMGGMQVERLPGAAQMSYRFHKDNTFIMVSNDKDKTNGVWKYDAKNKWIVLSINGKTNVKITQLKNTQLIMQADTREATPDDPMGIQLFFKPKPE